MAGSKPQTSSSFSWAAFQSHIRYLGTEEQKKTKEAFELGAEMHAGQTRRSGEPYFTHLIAVAHILADYGGDADTIIVALLHDALEDTSLSEDEIEERFGANVRRMIDALTKLDDADLLERPTLTGQVETIRKLFTFMQDDVRIMVIKLADRLHNMQTIEFLPEEKRQALAQETQDVYVKIADRLSLQDLRDELAELCHGVLNPEVLQGMLQIRSESERRAQRVIGEMKKAIALVQESVPIELLYESSRFRKLRKLYEAGGSTVTGVAPFSIAFICADIATCYQTLGALHQCWRREALSFQDFINAPMINGYQGLHTTMILEDGTRVRCKIRTRDMHAYARKGITTRCFDGRPMGLPSYLGWSQRISPLAEGTADRSEDFWESLQSDILGESIMVYGPGDQSMLLPEGSTVLDGAFHFLGDHALRLKSMRMDGKEVALQTPLTNAATIEVDLAKKRTVERAWLTWVRTGLALAKIREGLGAEPREKKAEEGRELLSAVMLRSKKVLLAEFAEEGLRETMAMLGFSSLEEGFIALAEGKLEPESVVDILFPARKEGRKEKSMSHHRYRIRFVVQSNDSATLRRLVDVYDHFHLTLQDIRILPVPFSAVRRFSINADFSDEERRKFEHDIVAAGGMDVRCEQVRFVWHQRLAIASIVLLWGLDPVVAHELLSGPITILDLTLMRFLVFFAAANILCAANHHIVRQKFKPLSPFHPLLLVSGSALFITGIATYAALTFISPTQYILLIIGLGVTLTSLIRSVTDRKYWIAPAAVLAVCIAGVVAAVFFQGFSLIGILFAALSAVSFGFYTEVSRRYQEEEAKVRARYPVYLFWLSLVALLCSLPLLPYTHLLSLPWSALGAMALFSFVFVFLPYGLYYTLVRSIEATALDRQLLFVCCATMVGEILITRSLAPLVALPVLATLWWWENTQKTSGA